jgi:hypothetical protein
MDSDFIEILESNVEDISTVTIEEERIKDGSEIFFNDQQIKSHLTNLLYTNDSQLKGLPKIVDKYFGLLKDLSMPAITDEVLLNPIIDATQNVYYVADDDYIPDADFEASEMIKMTNFDMFIEKFHKLNRDTRNPYTSTASKLYTLFCPFESNPGTYQVKAKEDSDSMDSKGRHTRVLAAQREVYKGDDIGIVGFYAKTNTNTINTINTNTINTINTNTKKTIDFDAYLRDIQSLKNGAKVIVVFNDFAFIKDALCSTAPGVVKGDQIHLETAVTFKNVSRTALPIHHEDYYVFPKEVPNTFSKRTIFKGEAKMTCTKFVGYDLYNAIRPTTPSQALFIDYDNISKNTVSNIDAINEAVSKYGFNPSFLPESLRPIIEMICKVKLPSKRVRTVTPAALKHPHESNIHFLKEFPGNNNLSRMVSSWRNRDNGLSVILQHFKEDIAARTKQLSTSKLSAQLEKLKVRLASLQSTQGIAKCDQDKRIMVTKSYATLAALYADDGHDCFWDANLDPTDYSLKRDIKSVAEIEKRLIASPKYSRLSSKEIEQEAHHIMAGRRKVQIGEHALLVNNILKKNIVFSRQNVQGKHVWIKVGQVDKCNDILPDRLDESTCVMDTFDKTCKSLKEVQLAKEIARTKSSIEAIESYLAFTNSEMNIDNLITLFKAMATNMYVRNRPFSDTSVLDSYIGHLQAEEDLDGYDIEASFAELANHIEAQDYTSVPLPLLKQGAAAQPSVPTDIVSIVTKILDISFQPSHITYMQKKLSQQYNISDIDKELLVEKDKLMTKVNMDMYNKNPDFKKKLDQKIEEKLKSTFAEKYSKFYYDETLFAVALITCMSMALFPGVQIERLIPRCSNKFSVVGYPLSSDKEKSLEMYILCVLKFFSVPEDVRYQTLLQKSDEELRKDVHKTIDEITENDYILYQSMQSNKDILQQKHQAKSQFETVLRPSYKPNFEFVSNTSNNVIGFLKTLNTKIRKAKFTKVNMVKSPFISNSCCPEQLREDIDYYTKEIKDQELTLALKKIKPSDEGSRWHKTYVPGTTKPVAPPIFQMKPVPALNTVAPVDVAKPSVEEPPKPRDNKYYNSVLLPKLEKDYDAVTDTIQRVLDTVDSSQIYFIRDAFIKGLNDDLVNTRNSLFTFVKNKVPLLLGRLIHGASSTSTSTSATASLTDSLLKNDPYKSVLASLDISALKNIQYFTGDDSVIIKNIAEIMTAFVRVLKSILDLKKSDPDSLILSCSICNLLLSHLYNYMDNTNYDIDSVSKAVETLRERRKEEMMTSYLVDDEQRSLQIQLRNMGVPNWTTMFEKLKNMDINTYSNHREEEENYQMADDLGENPDDDIED